MGTWNTKNFGLACGFTALLFLVCYEYLTDFAPLLFLFRHIDELLELICIGYLLMHIHFLFEKKRKLLTLWLLFLFVGVVSSVVYRYQSLTAAAFDILIVSRFMVAYLTAFVYVRLKGGDLCARLNGIARMLAVLFFALAVHDLLFTPFFPKGEFRYFTESLRLMFFHNTYLSAAMVTLLVVLGYNDRNYRNIPFMLMVSFVGIMTLRGKAIAFFLVYWALYFLVTLFRNRHFMGLLVGGGIGCVLLAMNQIYLYFFAAQRFSPRNIMLHDGVSLATAHFPLGTGFGTFGFTIAAQYYSPLYTQLGYPQYRGMNPDDISFLSDGFWPGIFGQFGWIGTVLFVGLVVWLVIISVQRARVNIRCGFAMLTIMLNMLINSIAETSFFNPTSFLLFLIFGALEATTYEGLPKQSLERTV